MNADKSDLQMLIERIKAGDETAASLLLSRYEPHLKRVIRTRFAKALRSKFDSVDFVQSVWRDFFGRLYEGKISFKDESQLKKFLTVVAQARMANEHNRRLGTEKFDVGREVDSQLEQPIIGHDPSPSETASAKEQYQSIVAGLPQKHKEVLSLRQRGFTFMEISERLGIDERTARRIVKSTYEKAVSGPENSSI